MADSEFRDMNSALLQAEVGAVELRRQLDRLIAAERQELAMKRTSAPTPLP